MQPTPPEVPSDPQPTPDSAPVEPSSEPIEELPQSPRWWRRLVPRALRGSETVEAQDEAATEAPPSRLTLTEEELNRRVQAETDRREAKRHAQALAERRRQLRDTDPWQFAEEERQAEQSATSNEQIGTFFANIGAEHDKYTLDPLVQSLESSEQKRILGLEGAGVGLDGRKLIVTEALKALEKQWKAEGARDAEARLRRNSAFRKQLLNEIRGQTREPDFLPSGNGSSEASHEVSDILRQQLGSRRSM